MSGYRLKAVALLTLAIVGGSLSLADAQMPKPKPKPQPKSTGAVPKKVVADAPPAATLLLKTDLAALVSLDGEPIKKEGNDAVAIEPNEIVRRSVPLGEHIVEAVSVDGLDKWHDVLAVEKVGQRVVMVELEAVREARITKTDRTKANQVQDSARAQRDAEAKASDDLRERERRVDERRRADQQQLEKQRQEGQDRDRQERAASLRSQISSWETRADRADRDADAASAQAENYEREAQNYESRGNGVSAALARTSATIARNRERSQRQQAAEAKNKVKSLERELSSLPR
jgi:hypothetical protein